MEKTNYYIGKPHYLNGWDIVWITHCVGKWLRFGKSRTIKVQVLGMHYQSYERSTTINYDARLDSMIPFNLLFKYIIVVEPDPGYCAFAHR